MQGRRCDDVGRLVRRLVGEGALRVGCSFVDKKRKSREGWGELYRRKWRLYRRESSESALRVGRSFVEKKGKAGRDGGSSIEESGGSTGESWAKVR